MVFDIDLNTKQNAALDQKIGPYFFMLRWWNGTFYHFWNTASLRCILNEEPHWNQNCKWVWLQWNGIFPLRNTLFLLSSWVCALEGAPVLPSPVLWAAVQEGVRRHRAPAVIICSTKENTCKVKVWKQELSEEKGQSGRLVKTKPKHNCHIF